MKKYLEQLQPYVIPAIAVILLLSFGKSILVALGISPDPKDEKKKQVEAGAVVNEIEELKNQGVVPSKPDAFWISIAESIYQALRYSAASDHDDMAVIAIKKITNDADFLKVQQYFGYRQEYWFGLPNGVEKPLQAFVSSNLSDSERKDVNNYLTSKNVSYGF